MGQVIHAESRFRKRRNAVKLERGHAAACTRCSSPIDPRRGCWVGEGGSLLFCDTVCWALFLGLRP